MPIAVIKTGGKQYKVQAGDKIKVEKLLQKENEVIEFDDILAGKKVSAKIVDHGKAKKIRVGKFRDKTGYKRIYGHRQPFSLIEIEAIK